MMLGYIYIKTRNLIYPMILHFLHNTLAVLLYRFDNYVINGLNSPLSRVEHVNLYLLIPAVIISMFIPFLIVSGVIFKSDPIAK
jgi:hypothetical protein